MRRSWGMEKNVEVMGLAWTIDLVCASMSSTGLLMCFIASSRVGRLTDHRERGVRKNIKRISRILVLRLFIIVLCSK